MALLHCSCSEPSAGRTGPGGHTPEGGREVRGAADHVLEHSRHRELRTGGRAVELVGAGAVDQLLEQGHDLVELLDTVHGHSSFVARGPRRRIDGLTVTAESDELCDRRCGLAAVRAVGHACIVRLGPAGRHRPDHAIAPTVGGVNCPRHDDRAAQGWPNWPMPVGGAREHDLIERSATAEPRPRR